MTDIIARLKLNAQDFTANSSTAFARIVDDAKNAASQTQSAFDASFKEIQQLAQRGVELPRFQGGALNLDVGGTREAAAAAEALARDYDQVAQAAERLALKSGDSSQQTRLFIAAAQAAKNEATQEAVALNAQALSLERLQAELAGTGTALTRVNTVSGAARAGAQQLSYQISDVATSFAGGINPMVIFAQQGSQIVQAVSLMKGEATGLIGFLGGPWGAVILGAVSILGVMGSKLLDTSDGAKAAEKAMAEFAERQKDIKKFIDETTGKLTEQNRTLVLNAVLTRQANIDANKKTISESGKSAFEAARTAAAGGGVAQYAAALTDIGGAGGVERNTALDAVIKAAGGDVEKLANGIAALAKTDPSLKAVALNISTIGSEAILAKRENDKLSVELRALNGDTKALVVTNTGLIEKQVALATATTAVERARAQYAIVQEKGQNLHKDDAAAVAAYTAELTKASKAVHEAEAAEKAAAASKRADKAADRAADKAKRAENAREKQFNTALNEVEAASNRKFNADTDPFKSLHKQAEMAEEAVHDQRLAEKELTDALRRDGISAVEEIANAFERKIGGATGKIAGDILSLAGGGRVNSPFLKLLQGGKDDPTALDPAKFKDGLDEVFKPLRASITKLEGGIFKAFNIDGDVSQVLGRLAGGAQIGGQTAGLISSSKASQLGGSLGGALGGELGKEFLTKGLSSISKSLGGLAGPLGSIAGGVIGSLAGGLFTKAKYGTAVLGYAQDGTLGVSSSGGNSGSRIAGAKAAGSSITDTLANIAQQLGGQLTGAITTSIGTYKDNYRVSTTGYSGKLNFKGDTGPNGKGLLDFGSDEQAAIKAAISDALSDGVITGISAASQRILASGKDIEKAIQQAIDIEGIPKQLKAMQDPFGAALDTLNDKFKGLIKTLNEAQATPQQLADAEKLYGLQREQIVKQYGEAATSTLKGFLDDLKGSDAYSLSQQESQALAKLQPYLNDIGSGKAIDQDAYTAAAQKYLDVERQLNGSTDKYFAAMDMIQSATNNAIASIDSITPIRDTDAVAYAKVTADATATAAKSAAATADLLTDANGTLLNIQALLAQLNANGGAGGLFPDSLNYAVNF